MQVYLSRACLSVISLIFAVSPLGSAQQFRRESNGAPLSAKGVIEKRLRSKYPRPLSDPTRPVPGRYLLTRAAARANALRSRIAATSLSHLHPLAASTAVFPGIQLRDGLPAGDISNSVVTGDFNKDGHMDFIVANGGTDDLWLYLGNGDGTFQLPRIIPLTRGVTPVYMVAADLRGNGILDLVLAEFDSSSIGILLGKGDGTFGFEQVYTLPEPPSSVTVDDFNHDGKLDIAAVMVTVTDPGSSVPYIATILGNGTGSFGTPIISNNTGFYSTANTIVSGDVNHDGLPDVMITGPGIEGSQVYLNAGNGTFTPGAFVIENGPFNVALDGRLGDLNGDGCLDAAVADANSYVWILLGDCAGNFSTPSSVPMGDTNSALRLIDLNGDGHLDLVTAATPVLDPTLGDISGATLSVALGDGRGNFAPGRNYVGAGLSFSLDAADFNGDGKLDVVVASPDVDAATVFLNDGSGGFGFPQGAWLGLPGVGVINSPVSAPSFADLNGDGKPDLVLLDEGYNGEYFITSMLNDGTGRFSGPFASDTGITIVANQMGDFRAADFRNTGHPDFLGIGLSGAYSTASEYILFAPGNGDGTFGKATFANTPGAGGELAVGDFNRDGKLDFVAVNSTAGGSKQVTTFLGNGDGTFRNGGSVSFTDNAQDILRVYAADLNRDGKLDLFVYETSNGYWTRNSYVWEFLGNGDGTFQTGRQLFSFIQPVTLADVNGDSWPDLVTYDFFWPDGTTQTLGPPKFTTYLGHSDGSFSLSSSDTPYSGISVQTRPYLQNGDPTAVSKVADLRGNGQPDEIAFQTSPTSGAAYAQILMGNGDGTFTPTYDVFGFNSQFEFPGFAWNLDGGKAKNLVELAGGSSSFRVFKSAPAPALQLELEEAQVVGNMGCGWVFPNVATTSDRVVTLSSTVGGVILPASATIVAGSLSQRFCYTLASNYDWHQVFDIRAQLGTDTAFAYAWQSYVAGFGEALSPATDQFIYPTQSSSPVTVTLTSSQGYTSTAQLSCLGLTPGESCSFGTATLTIPAGGTATTTVVVHTTAATTYGGPVTVLADDGNIAKRQSFNLTVQPLIVLPTGSPQTTSPGTSLTDVLIVGLPPYQPSCSGLPAGVTCQFSGNDLPYPSETDLGLNLNVSSGVAAGSYPFTVIVSSGGITASATTTLNITDFSIVPPTASSTWVVPGDTKNITFTLQPIAGFAGVVTLTCNLDAGGTCSGGQFPVVGSPSTAYVTVSVPAGTPAGTHTLTITGTFGVATHSVSVPLVVADYSGSLSQTTLTISRNGSGSLAATVSATTGFAATVSLACSGSSKLTCTFNPPTLQPTANAPAFVNITIAGGPFAALHAPGHYPAALLRMCALTFPAGLIFVAVAGSRRRGIVGAFFLFALLLTCLSCGGSGGEGGGGGGHGSNNYTLTVTATAAGTSTTRSVGTVNVTVTH